MAVPQHFILGLDFGSDSVRAVVIDAETGKERAISMRNYPRWEKGMYCDPSKSQFRQHPLDYLEAMECSVKDCLAKVPGANKRIKAIGIDMTGSTPVAVDKEGTPLALLPEFASYPNAMFIMWKDHTGQKENEYLNKFSSSRETDYTRSRLCGNYSVEHFWTKALHIFKDPKIKSAAHSFVEASDWLPGELTGETQPEKLKRGMGIASSRALWNHAWGGYPPNDYFKALDPVLDGLIYTFDPRAYTCNFPVGKLSKKWAQKFGLNEEVIVAVGNLDCHAGAIGAGVKNGSMVEIIGTSTVAITVAPYQEEGGSIPGVPQQARDMIIPGKMGYEGGQSAFGDLYAWFKKILMWPAHHIISKSVLLDDKGKKELLEEIACGILPLLAAQAGEIFHDSNGLIATDWINGRRSPHADFNLKGTIAGLTLSTTPPHIYKSLVEATAYGAMAFIEQFQKNGGQLREIIAVGGISHKSPFVMQVLADVTDIPIKVVATREACALGVAICAATAAGIHPSLKIAQERMKGEVLKIYTPNEKHRAYYRKEYQKYLNLEKVKNLTSLMDN